MYRPAARRATTTAKMPSANEDERLTVAEAAQEIGVSEKRTRQLIKDRELPAYRPTERKTYVLRRDLDAFLSDHRTTAHTNPSSGAETREKEGLSRTRT